jgi:peptidoglycan/xylan/chitin deacetylase (PgdA/CDA1 family)
MDVRNAAIVASVVSDDCLTTVPAHRHVAAYNKKSLPQKMARQERIDESAMSVRNALTIDVEDYFLLHVAAFATSIHRDSWTSRESRVIANTQNLLAMFEQFGVRRTFFVLGWAAEK